MNKRAQTYQNFRAFSDDDLRAAHVHTQVPAELARMFNTTQQTVTRWAHKLNLPLVRKQAPVTWTREQDELILACSEGKIAMARVAVRTHHSIATIYARAAELGIELNLLPGRKVRPDNFEHPANVGEYRLTVGEDKLLSQLYLVHGEPRTDVYPGSINKQ